MAYLKDPDLTQRYFCNLGHIGRKMVAWTLYYPGVETGLYPLCTFEHVFNSHYF